jgi:hypothetical protein
MEIKIKEGFEDQIFDFLIKHFTSREYQPTDLDGVPNPVSKEQTATDLLEKFVAEISAAQFIAKQKELLTSPNFLPK